MLFSSATTDNVESNPSTNNRRASSVLYRVNIGASFVHGCMLIAIVAAAFARDDLKLDMKDPIVLSSVSYATCKGTGNNSVSAPDLITTSKLDIFCQNVDNEFNLIPYIDYANVLSLHSVIMLCIISAISVLFHFGNAFIWREKYEEELGLKGEQRHHTSMFRWIENSLTFPIIILLLGYYSGVSNIHTLVLLVFLMFTIMWVAYGAELAADVNTAEGGWLSTVFERLRMNALAYLLLIFLYGVLFSVYNETAENGTSQGAPGYALGMLLSTFTLFLGVLSVQTTQMQVLAPPKFWYGEIVELALTSVLKLSFQITMILTVLTWQHE